MKEIILSKGQVALVDDEDFERVNSSKWSALFNRKQNWYAHRCVKKDGRWTTLIMSRFIMNVTNPQIHVDHIDGNGLNNQKINLRLCTNAQNMCNRRMIRGKKLSQYLGVYKMSSKWLAKLTHKQKAIIIGYYATEIEAAHAYNEAAKKYHGEFARPNII